MSPRVRTKSLTEERVLRIAFAGSATNPSHRGHRVILKTILSSGLFDLVIWYPSGFSDKPGMFPDQLEGMHRQQLALLAFPQRWVYDPNRGWAKLLLNFSATMMHDVPTALRFDELRALYPGAEITFVTGSDAVTIDQEGNFPLLKWNYLEKLATERIMIIPRLGFVQPDEIDLTQLTPFTKLSWLTHTQHDDIRSSHIRELIAANNPSWKTMVTPAVRDYIELYQLYRKDKQDG